MSETKHTFVTITLPRDRAERLAETNSDLLCWLAGWLAARDPESDAHSLLMDARSMLRRFNGDLRDAISRKQPEPEEVK